MSTKNVQMVINMTLVFMEITVRSVQAIVLV